VNRSDGSASSSRKERQGEAALHGVTGVATLPIKQVGQEVYFCDELHDSDGQ
jgi:SpoU rRNA methylase family enzyme